MAETLSEKHEICIRFNPPNTLDSIRVIGGSKTPFQVSNVAYVRIHLEGIRGGFSEIFGKKFNEVDGAKEARIFFYKNSKLIKAYSYEDIINFKYEMVDTMKVFVLNM